MISAKNLATTVFWKYRLVVAAWIFTVAFSIPSVSGAIVENTDHKFPMPELQAFHAVLHPLIRDALPKNDIGRIRRSASDLDRMRRKIVKAKLPKMTSPVYEKDVKEQIGFFDAAMDEFIRTVRNKGSAVEVEKAMSAVHDEFEELVDAINAGLH